MNFIHDFELEFEFKNTKHPISPISWRLAVIFARCGGGYDLAIDTVISV